MFKVHDNKAPNPQISICLSTCRMRWKPCPKNPLNPQGTLPDTTGQDINMCSHFSSLFQPEIFLQWHVNKKTTKTSNCLKQQMQETLNDTESETRLVVSPVHIKYHMSFYFFQTFWHLLNCHMWQIQKRGKTNTEDLFVSTVWPGAVCELRGFEHNCFSVFKLHLFIGNKHQRDGGKGPEIQYSNCLTLFHLFNVSSGSFIKCHKFTPPNFFKSDTIITWGISSLFPPY